MVYKTVQKIANLYKKDSLVRAYGDLLLLENGKILHIVKNTEILKSLNFTKKIVDFHCKNNVIYILTVDYFYSYTIEEEELSKLLRISATSFSIKDMVFYFLLQSGMKIWDGKEMRKIFQRAICSNFTIFKNKIYLFSSSTVYIYGLNGIFLEKYSINYPVLDCQVFNEDLYLLSTEGIYKNDILHIKRSGLTSMIVGEDMYYTDGKTLIKNNEIIYTGPINKIVSRSVIQSDEYIYNIDSGQYIFSAEEMTDMVEYEGKIIFSNNSPYVKITSTDNLFAGQSLHFIKSQVITIRKFNHHLLVVYEDGNLILYNLQEEVEEGRVNCNELCNMADINGEYITVCGRNGTLYLYDYKKEMELVFKKKLSEREITYVQFYKNGIVCGTSKKLIEYVDYTGSVIHQFVGHRKAVSVLCSHEQYLFSGSFDCTVKIWDMNTYELVRTIDIGTVPYYMTVHRGRLYITGSAGILYMYSLGSYKRVLSELLLRDEGIWTALIIDKQLFVSSVEGNIVILENKEEELREEEQMRKKEQIEFDFLVRRSREEKNYIEILRLHYLRKGSYSIINVLKDHTYLYKREYRDEFKSVFSVDKMRSILILRTVGKNINNLEIFNFLYTILVELGWKSELNIKSIVDKHNEYMVNKMRELEALPLFLQLK